MVGLVGNSIYYRNIRINQEAIEMLPNDGVISGLCSSITIPCSLEESQDDDDIENDQDAHLAESLVPLSAKKPSEEETIQKSIHQSHSPTDIWLACGITPVIEFHTEGYISFAFPTLFSTGTAYFLSRQT